MSNAMLAFIISRGVIFKLNIVLCCCMVLIVSAL